MAERSIATIFGGSGFVGRYITRRLAAQGHLVRVAVRNPAAAGFLKPMGAVGQVVPLFAPLTRPDAVARAVEGANIVINCVGILAEHRPGDFQTINADAAGALAAAATRAGAARLLHLSAIGADAASDSLYARSKAAGEAAVLAGFAAATILRPSVIFGAEDQFFNRFAAIAAWSPLLPVIHGDTRFQPVFVGDVAAAAMACLARADTAGRTYELAGPDILTFRDLLGWICATIDRHPRLVEIPLGLARLQARIAERLPGKPFTTDQLRLLGHDCVRAQAMPGLADLGIVATPIDLVVPEYLVRFRPGGAKKFVLPV